LPPFLDDLSNRCAEQIQLAQPISISFQEGRRQVAIGGLGQYACGGTHVENTSELNGLKIVRIKNKKDELSVHYEMMD
ncbi:alanine-tRNA synthetase second additional domain-containing protein, partial [Alcaligenes faecalis]